MIILNETFAQYPEMFWWTDGDRMKRLFFISVLVRLVSKAAYPFSFLPPPLWWLEPTRRKQWLNSTPAKWNNPLTERHIIRRLRWFLWSRCVFAQDSPVVISLTWSIGIIWSRAIYMRLENDIKTHKIQDCRTQIRKKKVGSVLTLARRLSLGRWLPRKRKQFLFFVSWRRLLFFIYTTINWDNTMVVLILKPLLKVEKISVLISEYWSL